MNNWSHFLHSFRFKVTAGLVFSLMLVAALSNYLIYQFSLNAQFDQLREQLKIIARTSAMVVNAEDLAQVPLNAEGVRSQPFQAVAARLRQIKRANPQILYVYTMVKSDRPGVLLFAVDADPIATVRRSRNLTSFPGDLYNAENSPEMLNAFEAAAADRQIIKDAWGPSLSGYAPIRDSNGKAIAILGVDISAENVYKTQRQVYHRAMIVLIIGLLASFGLGFVVSGKITGPIERLVQGTRHLADDLHYRVRMNRSDEIGQLAAAFDDMAERLMRSRKELEEYFYHISQSLIRLLESRDPYTRGHSDRVAEYSYKTSLRMGFSQDDADLLREVAQLHDIGKLSIHEKILNKEGKLNEEEWKIIRQHPLMGQEILEPIFINPKMLSVVRSHHERYDGTGYPDGIAGEKVDLAAQIVSVADAFDAMTSPRPYRQQLNRQAAMEELQKSSGTQLNPKVVEVFCRMIQDSTL